MTATFQLPEALLAKVAAHALQANISIDAVVEAALRHRLGSEQPRPLTVRNLPVISGRKLGTAAVAVPDESDILKDLELQHEIERYESAFRH